MVNSPATPATDFPIPRLLILLELATKEKQDVSGPNEVQPQPIRVSPGRATDHFLDDSGSLAFAGFTAETVSHSFETVTVEFGIGALTSDGCLSLRLVPTISMFPE